MKKSVRGPRESTESRRQSSDRADPAGGVSDPDRPSHMTPSTPDDYNGWELQDEPSPILLPMQGRSEGLHVSEIIQDICIRMGYLEARDDPFQPEWAELGNAMEHAHIQRLCLQFPDRYVQPGEVEKDGIFGTPDLLDCLKPYAIQEIKLAWISPKHTPGTVKFWRYETQIKCYCIMMEIGIGKLRVYHVNGGESGGPKYRPWKKHFSRQELEENWRMIRKHGDRLLRRREAEAKANRSGQQ